VVPVARAFEPDLVLVSAGFDAHRSDPLAGCRLESASFAEMARQARDLARRCEAPVGAILEGGYEPAALAESVGQTLAAIGGNEPARSTAAEPPLGSTGAEPPLSSQAAARIGRYWRL
jgi:acetoin utilization deacetylase AcuC-like enzyme